MSRVNQTGRLVLLFFQCVVCVLRQALSEQQLHQLYTVFLETENPIPEETSQLLRMPDEQKEYLVR